MKMLKLMDQIIDKHSDESVISFAESYNNSRIRTNIKNDNPERNLHYPTKMLSRLFAIAGDPALKRIDTEQSLTMAKPSEVSNMIAAAKKAVELRK
jgi:hypothetical protein